MVAASALLALIAAPPAHAGPDRSIGVVAGYGLHFSTEAGDDPPSSGGVFAEGEYVLSFASFVSGRAYTGVLITDTSEESCGSFDPCELSARLLFFGWKFRLAAPIPYVSPYFELGAGFSLGSLETRISDIANKDMSGGTVHVPVAIGVALGAEHRFDLSFSYLLHPTEDSAAGALAVGLRFPLGSGD